MAGVTNRDEIIIYRVMTSDKQETRQFLSNLSAFFALCTPIVAIGKTHAETL
jgi:hypothetical protein